VLWPAATSRKACPPGRAMMIFALDLFYVKAASLEVLRKALKLQVEMKEEALFTKPISSASIQIC
jgi:hypothetical protein